MVKGSHLTEEHKRKISESCKGREVWNKGVKGQVPWNKGMKMSDEYRKKLSGSHKGQIPWNKGMKGQIPWNKGKKASLETCKKLSEATKKYWDNKTPEQREKDIKRYVNAPKKNKSKLEDIIAKELNKLNIKYEKQKFIKASNRTFFVDFFLPEYDLIIECNGIYWHNLESRMIRDDELQDFVLKHTKYDLLFLWEHVIKSKHFCLKDILGEAGYLNNYLDDIVA